MKIQKPNWTPLELNARMARKSDLIDETEHHDYDCDCNRCMELFGLKALIGTFSEDEMATAVIEANKQETK